MAATIPPFALALKRWLGVIAVSDQYDPVELELGTLGPGGARARDTARAARRLQLRSADLVLCAGERQRAAIESEIALQAGERGPPVCVVPFGIDEDPAPPGGNPIREEFPQIGDGGQDRALVGEPVALAGPLDGDPRLRIDRRGAPRGQAGVHQRSAARRAQRAPRGGRGGKGAGQRARGARPQRLLPRQVDPLRAPRRVPPGGRPRHHPASRPRGGPARGKGPLHGLPLDCPAVRADARRRDRCGLRRRRVREGDRAGLTAARSPTPSSGCSRPRRTSGPEPPAGDLADRASLAVAWRLRCSSGLRELEPEPARSGRIRETASYYARRVVDRVGSRSVPTGGARPGAGGSRRGTSARGVGS